MDDFKLQCHKWHHWIHTTWSFIGLAFPQMSQELHPTDFQTETDGMLLFVDVKIPCSEHNEDGCQVSFSQTLTSAVAVLEVIPTRWGCVMH